MARNVLKGRLHKVADALDEGRVPDLDGLDLRAAHDVDVRDMLLCLTWDPGFARDGLDSFVDLGVMEYDVRERAMSPIRETDPSDARSRLMREALEGVPSSPTTEAMMAALSYRLGDFDAVADHARRAPDVLLAAAVFALSVVRGRMGRA